MAADGNTIAQGLQSFTIHGSICAADKVLFPNFVLVKNKLDFVFVCVISYNTKVSQ
jgi:hypothetical protein